ncbi:MAG TPA: DUF1080 domain-containing protein, partial [Planctomycetaceae bacterium]|nr:DUF1080 domain-containing protein [Planctomycetaceae bacterium]
MQEMTVMKRLAMSLGMFALGLAPLVGMGADGTTPLAAGWKSLSDEKQIAAWKSTPFGGEGEVERKDGVIRIGMGADLSGVTWSGTFPTQSYEIALDARRVDGSDFFCGLT